MDARLRDLERAAALGDPEAQGLLERERLRAGLRHQYQPHEITYYGRTCCSVARLQWGWAILCRAKVPRSRALRPPERFDLVVEWRSGPHGQFAPGRVLAVVPEIWLRAQAPRLGAAFIEERLRLSHERVAIDERIIREEREAECATWAQLITLLEDGPQVMPARRLGASVRRRLSTDPAFRIDDVGSSRTVIGRADARYDQLLADARARSARARRAAETRRQRITSVHNPQAHASGSRPPDARSSRPRPPMDEAARRRWAEALERLRGVVDSGDGLAIGTTPELRRITGLPSTAATSELLAAIRDGSLPEAGDLFCVRTGAAGEWYIIPNGPRR